MNPMELLLTQILTLNPNEIMSQLPIAVDTRLAGIMSSMSSQITSLTIVYSAVYSAEDERKHQSSASLAFVRHLLIPRTNGQ